MLSNPIRRQGSDTVGGARHSRSFVLPLDSGNWLRDRKQIHSSRNAERLSVAYPQEAGAQTVVDMYQHSSGWVFCRKALWPVRWSPPNVASTCDIPLQSEKVNKEEAQKHWILLIYQIEFCQT